MTNKELIERLNGAANICEDAHIAGTSSHVCCREVVAAASALSTAEERIASPTNRCDLFGNGSNEECGGPLFIDPQAEGVDIKVCAFHTLLNRNDWMNDAMTCHRLHEYDAARLALADKMAEAWEKLDAYMDHGHGGDGENCHCCHVDDAAAAYRASEEQK